MSGQWYLRNGGRDPALREELLARGRELRWHPPSMRPRYEDWVRGLTGDWIISRQRFFGVPIPLWYRVDTDGMPVYGDPLPPADSELPVDPAVDRPPGYAEEQRDRPGGFTADPDVFDTWATSSLTPQIAGGWADDPDLFARVFPYDLRPQSHEIIRTWLFATVLRAHTELGVLPWTDAAISGWVLDPDRKKMSKSVGNVVTPAEPLERFGSDAVRYWAAHARLGVDTTYDEGQLRVGRRLAVKLLNVARFVLRLPDAGAVPAAPVDRAALAGLAEVVDEATEAFARYDHAARARPDRGLRVGLLQRPRRTGEVARVWSGRRRRCRLGRGGAAGGARRAAAPARAVPAVRDRGGVVVVAGRVGARRVLARGPAAARGRQRRRPAAARAGVLGADRGAAGEERGETVGSRSGAAAAGPGRRGARRAAPARGRRPRARLIGGPPRAGDELRRAGGAHDARRADAQPGSATRWATLTEASQPQDGPARPAQLRRSLRCGAGGGAFGPPRVAVALGPPRV